MNENEKKIYTSTGSENVINVDCVIIVHATCVSQTSTNKKQKTKTKKIVATQIFLTFVCVRLTLIPCVYDLHILFIVDHV